MNKDEHDETLLEKLWDWCVFCYALSIVVLITLFAIFPMVVVELLLKCVTRSITWYHKKTVSIANKYLFPKLSWARGILIGKDEYGRKTSSRFNRRI